MKDNDVLDFFLGSRIKAIKAERFCPICGQKLNMYNKGPTCFKPSCAYKQALVDDQAVEAEIRRNNLIAVKRRAERLRRKG
jgi:NADH pyrophosphatase NudC (nudix superfamily)